MQALKKISCAVAGLLVAGSANAAILDLTTWSITPSSDGWVNVSPNWAELGGTAYISSNVVGVTSFDWFFSAGDELPYDDTSYYIAGGFDVVLASVATVGDYNDSGWNTFTFGSPYTGYFEIGIYNVQDNEFPSQLFIKNVTTDNVSAVPEPEAYAMLLAGLGLLGFSVRRKQSV